MVDSDDLSKGWLVKRIIGRQPSDEDEESTPAFNHQDGAADSRPTPGSQRWGPRGISVSADDTTREAEEGRLADPRNFEDEASDEDEAPKRRSSSNAGKNAASAAIGNGSEWQEGQR